ncbi:MAG: hypothetical protein SGI88_07760 [Candidatus Hydrogenedentes bacterium]|nr:hypothetical protein [Candidatus Hydrogenedentota bacterium]
MADITLQIDSETAKAIRDLVKFVQATDQATRSTGKFDGALLKAKYSAEGMGKADTGMARMSVGTDKAAAGLANLAGKFALVGSAAGALDAVGNKLSKIATESDKAANHLRALAVQVAGREGGAFVDQAHLMGAKEGLTTDQTGQIANTLKSIQGSDFKKDFGTGALLTNLGVEQQDASAIIQTGVTRGMGSMRAADLALKTADLAPWAPADAAKVMPKTMGYTSLESGLAAGATLRTAGVPVDQLPTSVEALGRVLSKEESPLAKKFKFKGMSEVDRIATLNQAAAASGDPNEFMRTMPEKYKVGEEESRALRAVMSQGDMFSKNEQALRATPAGEATRRFQSVMAENPGMRAERDNRIFQNLSKYEEETGVMGAKSQEYRYRTQTEGQRQREKFHPFISSMTTTDTGEANRFGMAVGWGGDMLENSFFPGAKPKGLATPLDEPMRPNVGDTAAASREGTTGNSATIDKILAAIEKNNAALEKNSNATEANSKATGGGGGSEPPPRRDRNAGV